MSELKLNKDERKIIISALKNYGDKKSLTLAKKVEKSLNPIKVSSAKSKGRNFQYWVCEQLAEIFGVEFNQSDDNCLIHSREMGQHGADIIVRDWVYKAFPFDVECKAQENLSLTDWINQAESNTKDDRDWLIAVKKQSIKTPFVVMSWNAFKKWLYMFSYEGSKVRKGE